MIGVTSSNAVFAYKKRAMTAQFQPNDPVPELLEQLIDGLHLLYQCRQRGVSEVDRLLEYIEFTIDEIERHRLGSSDSFRGMPGPDDTTFWCGESA